ncbi:MAG: tyrosine-type recombinase/integrase [Rhodoferax sp.]|nr:tyrosine-type recombinase/integrase [Rhodoferax sp.]
MALTDTQIKKAKVGYKPIKLFDGDGLFLHLMPTGSKIWRVAYRMDSKQKMLTIGKYPEVSLAQARDRCSDARKLLATDIDPVTKRREVKLAKATAAQNSFETVAREWWEQWKPVRSPRHAHYVMLRLENDVFPVIGAKPISAIDAPMLVELAKKIESRGAQDIAKRSLQTMGQIFRYAVAHGKITRNPSADVRPADVLKPKGKPENHARVDVSELPTLLRDIEAYAGGPATRLAMKLMALTFVRTSELIGARWSEFDLDASRWDIPSARMKMKTPHIVPLSSQAIEVLKTLQTITGGRTLLFPGERDHEKSISNNTILKALERMGYKGKMTGHGFRGVASTILHEHNFEHAHIELQLAHQERNKVSAAYNHAQYLPQRVAMMAWWGNYLESAAKGNVVPLKKLSA